MLLLCTSLATVSATQISWFLKINFSCFSSYCVNKKWHTFCAIATNNSQILPGSDDNCKSSTVNPVTATVKLVHCGPCTGKAGGSVVTSNPIFQYSPPSTPTSPKDMSSVWSIGKAESTQDNYTAYLLLIWILRPPYRLRGWSCNSLSLPSSSGSSLLSSLLTSQHRAAYAIWKNSDSSRSSSEVAKRKENRGESADSCGKWFWRRHRQQLMETHHSHWPAARTSSRRAGNLRGDIDFSSSLHGL